LNLNFSELALNLLRLGDYQSFGGDLVAKPKQANRVFIFRYAIKRQKLLAA
jgi:hypothetical protein